MDRLLLVDGSNLLFQMFFGMPARITGRNGKAIQGTLGFVGALLKILRGTRPTHAAVLFDGEHGNDRTFLDPDYKANRTDFGQVPENENPFSQLADVYAALDYLGIRHAETGDCETDDWIAGYALNYGGEMEVVISSFDSDYFQLITDHVRVLRYRGEKTTVWDPASVREKYGIEPSQYADFKALTGDPSDNIRGAYQVGPKTAAVLLNRLGSLEGVLLDVESIERPSIRESIRMDAERLRKNYRIIKLEGAGSLPFAISELFWQDLGVTTGGVLKGIGLR